MDTFEGIANDVAMRYLVDLLECGILGGRSAILSGEVKDAGFIRQEAMLAFLAVLLGTGDDSVVSDATMRIRRARS